jgi:hypothetical protein
MHHLMQKSPPDVLLDARVKHRYTQPDLDPRGFADSLWQADAKQCAARCCGHIEPIDRNPIAETAVEEHCV